MRNSAKPPKAEFLNGRASIWTPSRTAARTSLILFSWKRPALENHASLNERHKRRRGPGGLSAAHGTAQTGARLADVGRAQSVRRCERGSFPTKPRLAQPRPSARAE